MSNEATTPVEDECQRLIRECLAALKSGRESIRALDCEDPEVWQYATGPVGMAIWHASKIADAALRAENELLRRERDELNDARNAAIGLLNSRHAALRAAQDDQARAAAALKEPTCK